VDVSDPAAVEALVAGIEPPVAGVIHAAGVLADHTLAELTWADFEAALAGKAFGALHLDRALAGRPLDFFALYSSTAGVLGAPGQANYAGANAFLDALAAARWPRGGPGLSLAWSAWSETGMALRTRGLERTRALGLSSLTTREGQECLDQAFRRPATQLVVLAIERLDAARTHLDPHLLAGLGEPAARATAGGARPAPGPSWAAELAALPPRARRPALAGRVRERASAVLGLPAGLEIEADRPLAELGLDSLLSVELRNVLREAVGQALPSSLLFDYPTVAGLTGFLLTLLDPAAAGAETAPAAPAPGGATDVLGAVEGLSDEDVERRLSELASHD
jgi:acyl carrier protein